MLVLGGTVPLGYDVKTHKLVVNATEAERVHQIYRQYLKLGCVSKLKTYPERKGIRSSKERIQPNRTQNGRRCLFWRKMGVVNPRGSK